MNLFLTKEVLYQLSYLGRNGERAKRFELSTATLEGWNSTNWATLAKEKNGQEWFRTTVDVSQRIYSPSPLTTRAPTHNYFKPEGIPEAFLEPVVRLKLTTVRLQVGCSINWATLADFSKSPAKINAGRIPVKWLLNFFQEVRIVPLQNRWVHRLPTVSYTHLTLPTKRIV